MEEREGGPWLSNEEIGKKVKAIRLRKGLSQQELADLCGIPEAQASVSRWERGVRRPDYEQMLAIAKLVGRGVEIFQTDDDFAVGTRGVREESAEYAAKLIRPEVSFLLPMAREFYDRTVGNWFTRGWPVETINETTRELVAPITGYNVMRRVGQGFRELTDEDQLNALRDQAEEIEAEYGPEGYLKPK